MACGREGIRVAGTARHPLRRRLGILLWCKRSGGAGKRPKGRVRVLEFRDQEVGAAVDEAMFGPPPGSRVSAAKGTGRQPATNFLGISAETAPFGMPLGPVKAVAGMAAGGLGAAIRYSPLGWLFRGVKGTGSSEPIPDDDPPPGSTGASSGDGAPVSDELLSLLHRSGGGIPRFTGMSHQWMDVEAMLAGVPESARKAAAAAVNEVRRQATEKLATAKGFLGSLGKRR
jgi:hypothetical protein